MTTALRLETYAGISALSFLRKLTETWKRVILIACGPFPDSKVQWYEVKGLSEENSSKNVG